MTDTRTPEALTAEAERTLRRDIERGGPVTPGDAILLLNTLDAERAAHPVPDSGLREAAARALTVINEMIERQTLTGATFVRDVLDTALADSTPEPGLTEAWAEAEAALPQPLGFDWGLGVFHVSSGDGYFEPVEDGYRASATLGYSIPQYAKTIKGPTEPTPAAALLALASRLREGAGPAKASVPKVTE